MKKLILCLVFASQSALAGWSWNIGYHNPPDSTLGLNFMHLWSNWAFEFGIGSVEARDNSNNNNTSSLSLGGDINLKYLFGYGTFRPYLMLGMGASLGATSGDSTTAGANVGGSFGGLGLYLMGNPFYVYLGYVSSGSSAGSSSANFQAGLGFNF